MRVLVVDDSRAMRMIVTRELNDAPGVSDVSEAASAEAAIELLGEVPVDLIVCDWNMGGMTGLELLQALRAAGWTTPFGFVTSESSEDIVASAFASGASFLVTKPFTSEELTEKVGAVLAGEDATATPCSSEPDGELDRPVALGLLLEGLLRRTVTVSPVPRGPERQAARWTAGYLDTAGARVALCVVETPLASAMSAALTKMAPSVAAEWASSGTLPDALSEGFHEVTNVISKIVHASGERCILSDIAGYAPGEQLAEIDQVNAAKSAESYRVSVEGYASGTLSLVTFASPS